MSFDISGIRIILLNEYVLCVACMRQTFKYANYAEIPLHAFCQWRDHFVQIHTRLVVLLHACQV